MLLFGAIKLHVVMNIFNVRFEFFLDSLGNKVNVSANILLQKYRQVLKICNTKFLYFFFRRFNFILLNILAFSTYNFHLLRSWMQLVQIFIFSFFMPYLMSSSHLFFGLPSGRVNIGFPLYILFTTLSSGIQCKWPNKLNLWTFVIYYIIMSY